jgi:hypothetical protein
VLSLLKHNAILISRDDHGKLACSRVGKKSVLNAESCRVFSGSNGNVYSRLDQWLPMRLRSVQRDRDRRKGRGQGQDHNRAPYLSLSEIELADLRVDRSS